MNQRNPLTHLDFTQSNSKKSMMTGTYPVEELLQVINEIIEMAEDFDIEASLLFTFFKIFENFLSAPDILKYVSLNFLNFCKMKFLMHYSKERIFFAFEKKL